MHWSLLKHNELVSKEEPVCVLEGMDFLFGDETFSVGTSCKGERVCSLNLTFLVGVFVDKEGAAPYSTRMSLCRLKTKRSEEIA